MTPSYALALASAQCERAGMYERALFYFVASAIVASDVGEALSRVTTAWAGRGEA